MRRFAVCLLSALLVTSQAAVFGAELGRHPTRGSEKLPVEKEYQGVLPAAGFGLEAGLDWTSIDWDVGRFSYSDQVWAPWLSAFYAVNDMWDIRVCVKALSAGDTDKMLDEHGLPYGVDSDLSYLRFGIGSKVWFRTGFDLYPFVSAYFNYYTPDLDEADSVDGVFGASARAGLAYLFTEWFSAEFGFQVEKSLGDASVNIEGVDQDLSIQSWGFGLSLSLVF